MQFPNLARVMREDCQIDPGEPIVLGFSGGPDSLALLHALTHENCHLIVAHLDHGLRKESAEEADRARRTAGDYRFPFITERAEVAKYAGENSMSIEEAARELRYEFLFRVAAENDAQAVAVAHNADDQVETILMHLLRGAGTRGLRGMSVRTLPNPWSNHISLIRPLLGYERKEILDYCATNGLQLVMDRSNLDMMYFRNRLRHQLIPDLEKLAPGVKRRLGQTADLLAAEALVIDKIADQVWRYCLVKRGAGYLQLSRSNLVEQPLAVQRILIRRAAESLRPGLRDLDFSAVQRALELLNTAALAPQDWLNGLFLLVEEDNFWVADWDVELPINWPQTPEGEIQIEVPGDLDLNHWRLELREVSNPAIAMTNSDRNQAWLNHDLAGDELIVRRRRPGDRIQPLGMESGSMKLTDFMINEKMPKRARDGWPLLCKGDDIVWVPGYQLANGFRLMGEPVQAIHVSLSRV